MFGFLIISEGLCSQNTTVGVAQKNYNYFCSKKEKMKEKKPLVPNDSEILPDKPRLSPKLRGHPPAVTAPPSASSSPVEFGGGVPQSSFFADSLSLLSRAGGQSFCGRHVLDSLVGLRCVPWGFVTAAPPRRPRGQPTSSAAGAETAEGDP